MKNTITVKQEKVPVLGLGTYQLQGREGEKAITTAISMGYRHIDTAQFYQNENVVGKAVTKSGIDRKEFFITTKVWPSDFTKSRFVPAVERSLGELEMDYVDLLLLHWPSDVAANERGLEFLNNCLDKKYTRLVGVSNFNLQQLNNASKKVPVFCNQMEYHPYINQQEMLQYVQQKGLLLTAYTPLARGNVNSDAILIEMAEKYHKTPAQVTLRWLIQQKNVSPIPKAGTEKHLKENMELFDFEITREDMQLIFNLWQENKV